MKIKIILGIILPLILILGLAILGSVDVGFSVEKQFVHQITIKDVFSEKQLKNTIKLGDINIENQYFLGKRYDLKPLTACLIDKENVKQRMNAGSVSYSEGDYNPTEVVVYNYYNTKQERSVEIPANGKKTISIYLNPSYAYYQNYSQLLEQYKDYDEIVLVEQKPQKFGSYYNQDCYSFQQADIDSGINIPLILN